MPQSAAIAARCATLSDVLTQIILESSNFSRRVRDARHELNMINSSLLAIKTCLGIAQDDLTLSSYNFPSPVLEAMADILACCQSASERLHKPIGKLSVSRAPKETWLDIRVNEIPILRQNFEVVRLVLDLSLDHITLMQECDAIKVSTTSTAVVDPSINDITEQFPELLEKTTQVIQRIKKLPDESLLRLVRALESFITCTASRFESATTKEIARLRRSDPRSDSLELSLGDSTRSGRNSPAQFNSIESNKPGGIGAWLANVADNSTVHSYGPVTVTVTEEKPDSRSSSRARSREDGIASRGTFYNESTTTVNCTVYSTRSKRDKSRSRSRESRHRDSRSRETTAQSLVKEVTLNPTRYAASTVASSDVSIIHKRLTSDKIAIRKGRRKDLTPDQRAAIDWELRNIPRFATPSEVERILWEGANPNTEDPDFGYFAIRAAYELSISILTLLVEYGADMTRTTNTRYFSTLHAAVMGNSLSNVQYLIELGLPLDSPNQAGETPLHIAARTPGGYAIAKFLLDMGADVDVEIQDVGTPLQIAMTASRYDSRDRSMMIKLFLAHGAEGEGSTPESYNQRGKGLSVLGLT